jgi:hypothetical protein
MTALERLAALFAMTDAVWERHANPWSGWSRVPVLPLLALAIWARVWIGWGCLLPVAALLVWTWINPRAFPPPAHTEAWMTRAVLGERVYLNDRSVPIPDHHRPVLRVLTWAPLAGLVPMVWGLVMLDPWAAALGTALVVLLKLWFLDRMVWLWEEMRGHPAYAGRHRPRP